MRLILLGPPSAGKGTQAAMLSQRFGLLHLATGDLLRDAVAAGTSLGRKAKKFMDSGALVPDAIVLGLLEGKMKSTNSQAGFILDGFPRSIEQAERLSDITDIDLVLCIDVDYDKLMERATGRRVCRKCGAVYHIRYNPPRVPNVCDRDGGALYQRDDDREDVVRKRLRTYEEQTRPVINYYQAKGMLKFVEGDASIEEVGKRLLDAIEEQWPQLKGAPPRERVSAPATRAQPAASISGSQTGRADTGQPSHGSRKQRGKGRRGRGGGRYFKKFDRKGKR